MAIHATASATDVWNDHAPAPTASLTSSSSFPLSKEALMVPCEPGARVSRQAFRRPGPMVTPTSAAQYATQVASSVPAFQR